MSPLEPSPISYLHFLKSICSQVVLQRLSESLIKNDGSMKVALTEIGKHDCAFSIGRIRSDPFPYSSKITDSRRVAHNELSLQKRKAIIEQLTPK